MEEIRTILFLAANPKDTPPLRLNEEQQRIKDSLRRSRGRGKFNVQAETAATIGHIRRALLEHRPEVVHFCGHGEGANGIVFEDESGEAQLIPTQALANLFQLVESHVKCVVLNACFAEVQANEVVRHIGCVVGMKYSIGDRAALKFAEGFYDALFNGESFPECFQWGVNSIQLESIPEDSTPVMKMKARPAPRDDDGQAQTVTEEVTMAVNNTAGSSVHSGQISLPAASSAPPPRRTVQRKVFWGLLVAALLTVGFISTSWAWPTPPEPSAQSLVGSYTQDTYDEDSFEDNKTTDGNDPTFFKVESVHALIAVSADPATGRLSTVEVTTNQISYPPLNKVITTYTAEWRYKEVERSGPAKVTLEGFSQTRFAFNEVTLHGLMPEDVAQRFDRFRQKINRNFQTARAELQLNPEGRLRKSVTYNGRRPKVQTYIRN